MAERKTRSMIWNAFAPKAEFLLIKIFGPRFHLKGFFSILAN